MLVPMSWLREFVPYEGDTQALGDKLTMLGLELEGILHPFSDLAFIKVGFVAQCLPHPDSDHLHCCKVDLGEAELVDIVCGAPNVAEGQKVAVAPVGSRLPDGTKIKKSKLRGKPSNGMICSERELGLSDDHSGIMVLSDSLDTGHSLLDALNLDRDVLDLSITPNRGDCLSILGIARECALAFNLPLHVPELPMILDPREPEINVPVKIHDPDLCYLYAGRVVTGLKIGQSPLRMRCRLISVGARPISNIVDITNYILFEIGQPLHAFDLDKLAGRRIEVRNARSGESFITLDGKSHLLKSSDLCICDEKGPVALAGVMGGLDSEITAESKNLFLESAVFQPKTVRKTSHRLGINSEAAFRFERGVDQRRSIWALDRACAMMASIAGGLPNASLSCEEPRPFIPTQISYRPARAEMLLGMKLPESVQANNLNADGCAINNREDSSWTVIQPSWRHDLTREADLIEEVGRIYGLDALPARLPAIQRQLDDSGFIDTAHIFRVKIKQWGAGLGLNEVINYSFVGHGELDDLKIGSEKRISIANPLSEEMDTLRTSVVPGLLQDLRNNLAFGAQTLKIFEIATVFESDNSFETTAKESPHLGILLNGLRHDFGWPRGVEEFGYGDIKGILQNLFWFLKIGQCQFQLLEDHGFLHPAVKITANNRIVGEAGCLKPDLAKKLNAQKQVWLAELDLELLYNLSTKATMSFRPLPIYPAVRRDITVIVPKSMEIGLIETKILAVKSSLLESAVLADLFEPENSQDKNVTFRLTFRHPDRTLKDLEADKEREKIADMLRKEINARI